MQYSQYMTLGKTIDDRIILAKLTPVERTYGNSRKNVQRSAVLASGRTVSDYIATIRDFSIDFKHLGFNRWTLKDTQELMAIPLDGSEVNLTDWTLGSVTIPTDTSYYYSGYVGDELALFVAGSTPNFLEDSGFEYNSTSQLVFSEQFSRYSYDPSNSFSIALNSVASFPFIMVLPAPLVESYDLHDVENFATPQYSYGTQSIFLENTTWVGPANIRTMPQTQGTVEFWFAPQSWIADSSIRNLFFTTDQTSFNRLMVNYDGFSFKAVMYDAASYVDVWSIPATITPNSYMHFAVTYALSYGVTGFYVNGVSGIETRPVSWVAPTVLGTSFGLNGGNTLRNPFLTATGLYSNLRITYNRLYRQAFTPPTSELDLIDQEGFPVTFKNNTSWQQMPHVLGLGWKMYPTAMDGTQKYIHIKSIESGLSFQTNGSYITFTGGNSYWQDMSYALSWAYNPTLTTTDLVALGAHENQYSFGNSAQFDGLQSRVFIQNSFGQPYPQYQIAAPLTMCMWARIPVNAPATMTLAMVDTSFGSRYYYGFQYFTFFGNGGVSADYYNGSNYSAPLATGGVSNDGEWHHYAMTISLGIVTLYVDGVFNNNSTVPISGIQGAPNGSFGIGCWPPNVTNNSPASFFQGYINDVQIYNAALSSDQIHQIAKEGGTIPSAGLVGWWKLNTGSTITDSSNFGNNGTSLSLKTTPDAPYAANKVVLDVSYSVASFVSTYPGDPSDTIHYWRPNQIRDRNMETANIHAWDAGTAVSWNVNNLNMQVAKSTVLTHGGSQALHLTASPTYFGAPIFPHQSIAVNSGESYYVSLWYYANSGSFKPVLQDGITYLSFNPVTTLGQWTFASGTFTTSASFLRLDLQVTPGSDIYIDDLELKLVPTSSQNKSRNWFPDGNLYDTSYALSIPYTTPSSTLVNPTPNFPTPGHFFVGTGPGILQFVNTLPDVTVNVTQSIYNLPPGTLQGVIKSQSSYNGFWTATLTCLPSGNTVSFGASFSGSDLINPFAAPVQNTSFGPLVYLPTDDHMTLTISIPILPTSIFLNLHENWINFYQFALSYPSENGSYVASINSTGQNYVAAINNGVTSESWLWSSSAQHTGNITIEGAGSWSTKGLGVYQLGNPAWNIALPLTSYEGVTHGNSYYGAGSVAIDPNNVFHGKFSLNLSAHANISFNVFQNIPTLPAIMKGVSLESQVIGNSNWKVRLTSPTTDLADLVIQGPSFPWTHHATGALVGVPLVLSLDHTDGVGSIWFDNAQMSKAAGAPYFDTSDFTIDQPPIALSFNASYINPGQGTAMFYVSPQSFSGNDNGNWMLFTVYRNATDYFKVYVLTRNYGASNVVNVIDSAHGLVLQGNMNVNVNGWNHFALTWDANTCKIYINGSLNASGSIGPHLPSSGNLTIGWSPDDSSSYQTWAYALFEKFYIMDRPLSSNEIYRVRDNTEIEGLSLVELTALAESGTGTFVHTFVDLRGNSFSFNTLIDELPVTNISGDLRHADVNLKLIQKDQIT